MKRRRTRCKAVQSGPAPELSEYEKIQQQNIKERQEQFRRLQIEEAKRDLTKPVQTKKRRRPTADEEEEMDEEEMDEEANEETERAETDPEVDGAGAEQEVEQPPRKKRSIYMTKRKLAEEKRQKGKEKLEALKQAKLMVQAGAKCLPTARAFGLPATTLSDFIKAPAAVFQPFKGKKSKVLTEEEEQEVADMIVKRKDIGHGMTFPQLQQTFQTLFKRLCAEDPTRKTGFEKNSQLPPMHFCYRFINRRACLSLRASMQLSPARAALSLHEVTQWYTNFETRVLSKPGMAEAFMDPRRICNAVS